VSLLPSVPSLACVRACADGRLAASLHPRTIHLFACCISTRCSRLKKGPSSLLIAMLATIRGLVATWLTRRHVFAATPLTTRPPTPSSRPISHGATDKAHDCGPAAAWGVCLTGRLLQNITLRHSRHCVPFTPPAMIKLPTPAPA